MTIDRGGVYVLLDLMATAVNQNQGTSEDTKTIVTVLLLVFLYPIGVIVMFFWPRWPVWVKVLLSLPILLIPFLAVFLSVILVAINPAKQFSQANNTQRRADVGGMLNAIYQYESDHKGQLPPGLASVGNTPEVINSTGRGVEFCNALVPTYFVKLPVDPKTGSYTNCNSYDTGYIVSVAVGTNGKPLITVSAPGAELEQVISITR